MTKTLFILISLLAFGCKQSIITPVTFDSRDYEFNDVILKTLQESKEVGFSATRFSFVSEHELLLQTLETNDSIKNKMSDSLWTSLATTEHSARDYIIQKSDEHEIIMFNENHSLPRHRHFLKSLLPDLYDKGYKYLALEAIGMLGDGTMFDKDLKNRGYPMKYTGHYIKDPEFSLLVRTAIDLNFHIIGYDEGSRYGYSGGDREERGAENILSQMKSTGNQGKLIVLCGYDHLKEGNSGSYWDYALAERLKRKTGYDPFTINQTQYNERLNKQMEDPLMQRIEPNQSIVLLDKDQNPLDLAKDTAWYDAFVIHARTKFDKGIPNWILEEGPLEKFNLSTIEMETPYKIFVFESGDDIKIASPIFVCEIKNKQEKVTIPTRGKKIKLVITNKKESMLLENK